MSSSSTPPQNGTPRRPVNAEAAPHGYPGLGDEPVEGVRLLRAPAVPTAVVRADHVAMSTIAGLFDTVFGTAFPAAFARGLKPAGAAFALYTSLTDGADPVADVEIVLPAGDVAVTSHLGGYDGLGRAWGDFLAEIGAMGWAPGTPFWETYVTEPSPDMDPADLRTDLYCVVRRPDDAA